MSSSGEIHLSAVSTANSPAALLPHALAVLALSSPPIMNMANYLGYSGSYAAARDLSQQILDARRQDLGAERLDTLAARGDFAHWTGEGGSGRRPRPIRRAAAPA